MYHLYDSIVSNSSTVAEKWPKDKNATDELLKVTGKVEAKRSSKYHDIFPASPRSVSRVLDRRTSQRFPRKYVVTRENGPWRVRVDSGKKGKKKKGGRRRQLYEPCNAVRGKTAARLKNDAAPDAEDAEKNGDKKIARRVQIETKRSEKR